MKIYLKTVLSYSLIALTTLLDKTIHIFSDTDFGGIQQVIAMDSDDAQQVQLIQEHLVEQAQRFAVGDFGDPSFLHGYDMPGLTALIDAAKEGLLTVSYETLPNGAAISYSSENLQTIIDLHLWFQAQVTDHGSHATNQSMSADTSDHSNNDNHHENDDDHNDDSSDNHQNDDGHDENNNDHHSNNDHSSDGNDHHTGDGLPTDYVADIQFALRSEIVDAETMAYVGLSEGILDLRNPDLSVKEGHIIEITLSNTTVDEHDMVIELKDKNIHSEHVVFEDDVTTFAFEADKAGHYYYYCTVEGHREAGMEGVFHVDGKTRTLGN